MNRFLDKLMEFFSSLKLAICLILSLAFYLGAATCYEARYGTRAVQEVIYNSKPFILLMALLAINVMGAVIVRYPWKRKQTGFIITHCGIEILLLGCLLSFRFSVDGRVELQPGGQSEEINLNDEEIGVTAPDAGGLQRRHVIPVNLWADAGYPGLAQFVLASAHLIDLPQEPRWPEDHSADYALGEGLKLHVLQWLPAAVPETVMHESEDGFPTAMLHLGGSLPNGMPMDQDVSLTADGAGGGWQKPFGGQMDMTLWKARSDAEVKEFLNPPPLEQLPEMGRLAFYLGGTRYELDVKSDMLGKTQTLGDSGFTVSVDNYHLQAPDQLPEDHAQLPGAAGPAPAGPPDPSIYVHLNGPSGKKDYMLTASHPQFMADLNETDMSRHGVSKPTDPLIYYWHPQAYFTTKAGTRGRLQLLAGPDGKLYARLFKLKEADGKYTPPFEVEVGKEMSNFWLSISLTINQFSPSAILAQEFRPAHVEPNQMDMHMRAMKVAVEVDGVRQEVWLARQGGDVQLNTPRGTVDLDYGYAPYELGFAVHLNHAEQTNDPGTDQAAAYSSEVAISGTSSKDGTYTISMNKPLSVQGLTFYQAGFDQDEDGPLSTLSVRHDPGWVIKYLGCALIVGGIFTMFYMKAYFQKTPAPAQAPAKNRKAVSGKAVQVG